MNLQSIALSIAHIKKINFQDKSYDKKNQFFFN